MEYIYIVKWFLISISSTPCPESDNINEFGERSGYATSCSVLHLKVEKTNMSKTFFDRDSALSFAERGNEKRVKYQYSMGVRAEEFTIDSVKLLEDGVGIKF